MSNVQFSSGDTALAEGPGEGDDEFALDVRVVVAHGPVITDCATDDGCGDTCEGDTCEGDTCEGDASACNSFADDPS